MLDACTVEPFGHVSMGAYIGAGAKVESHAIVAAGAKVAEGTVVPSG